MSHILSNTFLMRFMPEVNRDNLIKILRKSGVEYEEKSSNASTTLFDVTSDDSLKTQRDSHLIPSIEFYDIPQHVQILNDMFKDFSMGEHLLLVGNQGNDYQRLCVISLIVRLGTGKNKICDRFLQRLQLPREYIQLHRDTTIQSLTLQPSISNGNVRPQAARNFIEISH